MANDPDAHVLNTVLEKLPKYGLELVEIRSEDGGLVSVRPPALPP